MPSDRPTTTIRYTDEDRKILEKLQALTGLESASAVVRLAIREALASRQSKGPVRAEMLATLRRRLAGQSGGAPASRAKGVR
jgi:hypothetical protein